MHNGNGLDVLEPIELYLLKLLDRDRLSMYQIAIDTIKTQKKFAILDSVNSILDNCSDESPSEVEGLIYNSLTNHLRDMLAEYDIIVSGGGLPFLTRLVKIVNLLDSVDTSQAFIDIASNLEYEPKYRLYQLITLLDKFDEEEYMGVVNMVSMSLLERLVEVHQAKIEEAEQEEIPANVDLTILRKVASSHTDLTLNRLLAKGLVRNVVPTHVIIQWFQEEMDDTITQPDVWARELIAVFLIGGKVGPELLEEIRSNLPTLITDDNLLSGVSLALNRVYSEMTA